MKIALIGYGKMGKAIEEIALEKNEKAGKLIYDIIYKFDIENQDQFTVENLKKVDVAIEFTSPHTAIPNIMKCFEANIPIVVGSTGWTDKLDEIKAKATETHNAFLFSPNYSIGVNIFFEINRQLARIMNNFDDYEIEVEEIHHTEKKDAPSGTGLFAALDILKMVKRKEDWLNEKSANPTTLPIISLRLPEVPGTHTVTYYNEIDNIELKHTAHNRKGFAGGALLAAEWIIGKKGAFSMDDVFGFNK
jgi:4-hydroxy-tetrahydrodipicolinate reductase